MKQHIDTQQLSQLTDKGMERLQNWFLENKQEYIDQKKKDIKSSTTATEMFIHHDLLMDDLESLQFSDAYLLSIGQMIWFLEDEWMRICVFNKFASPLYYRKGSWSVDKLCDKHRDWACYEEGCSNTTESYQELVDALWSACVEILNRE